MLVSKPPNISVASFMGFLKGKNKNEHPIIEFDKVTSANSGTEVPRYRVATATSDFPKNYQSVLT